MNSDHKFRYWRLLDASYSWNILFRNFKWFFTCQNVIKYISFPLLLLATLMRTWITNWCTPYTVSYLRLNSERVCCFDLNQFILYLNLFNVLWVEFWQSKSKYGTETISLWIIIIWFSQSFEERSYVQLIFAFSMSKIMLSL
jgi:hypothetical protein